MKKIRQNTFQTTKSNHGSLQIFVEKEAVAEEASYLYVCRPTEEGHKAAGWKTLEQNTSTTCVTTFMNNQPLFGQGRWVELDLLVVVYTIIHFTQA